MKNALVEVQNMPEETEQYIVARYVAGELWYWGSWDNRKSAQNVADTFENGIVVEHT